MGNANKEKLAKFRNGEVKLAELFNVDARQVAALLLTGHNLYQQGKLDEAKAIFEGLSVLDGRNPYVHAILGAIYQKQQKHDVAIARYTLALGIFHNDPNSLTNRGEIYLGLGRLKEAAADFKKAIELDPQGKIAASNRARILVSLTANALKLANEQGVAAVYEVKKRMDQQLPANT